MNKNIIKTNENIAIIGGSRSGKTYAELERGRKFSGPTLFFNWQHTKSSGYMDVDYSISDVAFRQLLQKNKKISYIPYIKNKKFAISELASIIEIMQYLGKKQLLILDEVDEYCWQGLRNSPAIWALSRGSSWGIVTHFITQYPARADKTLFINTTQKIIHETDEFSGRYLNNLYGQKMVKQIKNMLKNKGQYSYVILEKGEIKGVYKE